jgi:signal transduction histidine kinase
MRVGQRLFLAVLPAILGVFTVVGLAYWGEYARQAPQSLIIVAIVAAVVSLGMAWHNTRYVAHRIEHLALRTGKVLPESQTPRLRDLASAVTGGVITHSGTADELDTIESTVHDMNSAVQRAHDAGESRAQRAEARQAEYAAVIDEVARLMTSRLEEAEMPLHVLLASPFGSLNENQEEMLAAAQTALDLADRDVRLLRTLLALDRGELSVVPQPIGLTELLKPALAIAQAHGRSAKVAVHADISETAPRVIVDAMQTQAALTAILTNAVTRTPVDGEIDIKADESEHDRVQISVRHGETGEAMSQPALDIRLARRLIGLQRGALRESSGNITIELPGETPVSAAKAGSDPLSS